jgi:hypothetical protein
MFIISLTIKAEKASERPFTIADLVPHIVFKLSNDTRK